MAAWFSASSAGSGTQLYKLGNDESVTKWTDPGFNLNPFDLTFFNNAVWFGGETPANGEQLYKLGNDGSVTKWTNIGANFDLADLTVFNDALWLGGFNAGQHQLYKLANDGSVTQWTANPGSGNGLDPFNMTAFNDALWFDGNPRQRRSAVQVGKRWQRDAVDRHRDRLERVRFDRFQQCIVVQRL